MLKTQKIEYQDGSLILEGYYSYDDSVTKKRPAVLVCHDWSGKNDFVCQKADQLAELGYVGFAIDMYGKGKIGNTKEEKTALMTPLVQDRAKLQQRMLAAYETVKTLGPVETPHIGAIGFCFGGLCALDLARSGADVKGVVSFHGALHPPENTAKHQIMSKILVLHGFDDPMVTTDQVIAFGQEMTHAKVDWQIDIYGNAMHAFTNPQANDPSFGTVYEKNADARSWAAMKTFFKEVF
ncbi:MAG: dienelactone hydrolase family protein [Gammaproteobacteria bacterium]|nr:dienelactone hydrolase family protein [Gammaproteobacteria bacterium]MCW5582578.1 dienelactone hydrolase family protein [Gammaproteobacteria bacterium]